MAGDTRSGLVRVALLVLAVASAGRWWVATGRAAAADPPATGTAPATVPAPMPATTPAPATAPAAAAALRPFTAFAWHFSGPRPHVKAMYYVGPEVPPWQVAQTTRRMGDGARVLLASRLVGDLVDHPLDVCRTPDGQATTVNGVWPAHGTRAVGERVDAYLAAVAAAGGAVDLLAVDFEGGYSCWEMTGPRLAAVGADPRFPAVARALGLDDPQLALFGRSANTGEYLRWNAVMDRTVTDALNAAVFVPLRRHFPRAGMCNYEGAAMDRDQATPDGRGDLSYKLVDPPGTHQAPQVYGSWNPVRSVPGDWVGRPYLQVLFAANLVRANVRSSPMPVLPWVIFKSWRLPDPVWTRPLGGSEYWAEAVVHAMLSGGTDNVLYFNPADPGRPRPIDDPNPGGARPADDDAMEAVMADVERQAGGHRIVRSLSAARVAWDAAYLVSSARLADGSTLARVTFDERAGHADLTIGGRAVRVQRPVGQVGVWLRVPAK